MRSVAEEGAGKDTDAASGKFTGIFFVAPCPAWKTYAGTPSARDMIKCPKRVRGCGDGLKDAVIFMKSGDTGRRKIGMPGEKGRGNTLNPSRNTEG